MFLLLLLPFKCLREVVLIILMLGWGAVIDPMLLLVLLCVIFIFSFEEFVAHRLAFRDTDSVVADSRTSSLPIPSSV